MILNHLDNPIYMEELQDIRIVCSKLEEIVNKILCSQKMWVIDQLFKIRLESTYLRMRLRKGTYFN